MAELPDQHDGDEPLAVDHKKASRDCSREALFALRPALSRARRAVRAAVAEAVAEAAPGRLPWRRSRCRPGRSASPEPVAAAAAAAAEAAEPRPRRRSCMPGSATGCATRSDR